VCKPAFHPYFESNSRLSTRRCVIGRDRGSFVPTALGSILVAAGAADGHELLAWVRDKDWSLLARAEMESCAGLSLLCGLAPRWTRISAMTAFVGISTLDLVLCHS
jgi:hypothetical protein